MATVVHPAGGALPLVAVVAVTLFIMAVIAMNGDGHGPDEGGA